MTDNEVQSRLGRVKRVVVGSPIQQRPAILAAFLKGLEQQFHPDLELSFVFIDDNHDASSSDLLRSFAENHASATVHQIERIERYVCDDATTHHWREDLIWRVAGMKDAIIEHAIEDGADALFFIDSDIVLQPGTIAHLVGLNKAIVSEVFWTSWERGGDELPQVWLSDVYELVARRRGENLTPAEASFRLSNFLKMLRVPGTYEVGGLGACTLLDRSALLAGVRFAEIPNLSFWGEDRHFCVRAAALGIALHADTHLPPLHLYREEDLLRTAEVLTTEVDLHSAAGASKRQQVRS